MKNLFTVLAIVCSFMWTSREVSAQVKFRIGIMPDKVTYQVFLRPDTTWAPPFNSTVSSQLSLRVPTGGFQANNVASNKGSWKKAVHVIAPSEAPDYDYLSFSLSLPTNDISYSKGTEVLLFTFQNTGNCTGEIKFIDNQTDPFLPPNSQ
ncbi:MAG TPA: hypothetical protein PKC40_14810, partial [Saprospiraceae bacterium]|nr:hypothetical protein [Saprospiraceae bacterium]